MRAVVGSLIVGVSLVGTAQHIDAQVVDGTPHAEDEGNDLGSGHDTTEFELDDDTGDIEAAVSTGGGSGTGVADYSDEPVCDWYPAEVGEVISTVGGGEVDPSIDPFAQAQIDYGPVTHLAWWRKCGDGPYELVLLAPIDPVDLVPGASERVRSRLQSPTPNVNPDPAAGGIVNLGVWYAVEDPGTIQARATLPGVWAEVTGSLVGISVDPGTGDVPIACPGVGVAIEAVDPSLQTIEPGPCGYTYRNSSPDDAPFQMTITNIYEVTWRTSDGRSGSLGQSRRPVTLDYDIDEIQTIGTR